MEDIVKKIYNKDKLVRYAEFLLGITLLSLSFNIFLLPNNLISGLSGISIMFQKTMGFNPSIFILVCDVFLLILSYFLLGFDKTKNSIIGSLIYPVLISLTAPIASYVDLTGIEPIVLTVIGSTLSGFSLGLVFKAGFTTGGVDILEQIMYKYFKISIGTSIIIIDGIIITSTLFVLGFQSFIYSIIAIYIMSMLTDKVLLGISKSKTIYVITENETDVKKFIMNNLSHGVTVLDGRGGYTGNNQKVIMCIIPTREYFLLKEGIKAIDNDAFVIATDAYEVLGGK